MTNNVLQESIREMSSCFKDVAKSMSGNNEKESSQIGKFEKILNQLEAVSRLRRTYEQLPESNDEEKKAKRFRIQQIMSVEEELLKLTTNHASST